MNEPVCIPRNDIFFHRQLYNICKRLKQPEKPNTIRAYAVLNNRTHSPFRPDCKSSAKNKNEKMIKKIFKV